MNIRYYLIPICALVVLFMSSCFDNTSELELDFHPYDVDYEKSFAFIDDFSVIHDVSSTSHKVVIDYRINPEALEDIENLIDLNFDFMWFAFEVFPSDDVTQNPLFYFENPFINNHILNEVSYNDIDLSKTYTKTFLVKKINTQVCISFMYSHSSRRTPSRIEKCFDF